jgi:hypothetical protein
MVSEPVRPATWGSLRLPLTSVDSFKLMTDRVDCGRTRSMVRGRRGGRR